MFNRSLQYKKPRQESGLCCFSFARYSQKCVTQIYRALYGDAMFVPFGGTNMAAGNQQKHLPTEFCYKSVNLSLEELTYNTVLLFLMQELFRWPNSPK